MIKSFKIENTWSYFKEQKVEFFESFDDLSKNMNYFFGLSGVGKSSLFNTLKSVLLYMKRWIKFSGEDEILKVGKNFDLKSYFNPNINSEGDIQTNFTNIEIVFALNNLEYKYQLSYNDTTCNYENFYYRDLNESGSWIAVFEKTLLSCDFIDNSFTSLFKHKISNEALGVDFNIFLKDQNLNNSIFSYVVSFDKSKKIKKINEILENIIFLEEKDFQNLNEYSYPHYDFIENKKMIIEFLNEMGLIVEDITIGEFNKITGFYKLNLILKNSEDNSQPQSISSSKLSNEERKILLLSFIYSKYINQNKIIIIDDFTFKLKYSTFEKAEKIFKRLFLENGENNKSQFIFLCSNFFNKTKKKGINYSNIFNIAKNIDNTSSIKKITEEDLLKDKEDEINSLKAMLNVTTSFPIANKGNDDLNDENNFNYENAEKILISKNNESESEFKEYFETKDDNELIKSREDINLNLNENNFDDDFFDDQDDQIDKETEDDLFYESQFKDENILNNEHQDNTDFINSENNDFQKYKGMRIFSKKNIDDLYVTKNNEVDDDEIKKMVSNFFKNAKK